jgi:hypothetical protein
VPLQLQQKACLLFLQNNDSPVLYGVNEKKTLLAVKRK